MNDNPSISVLEQKLRAALGSPKQPDFDAWQLKHAAAIARLTPAVTLRVRRDRRFMLWTMRTVAALAVCLVFVLLWKTGGERESFAQAIKSAEGAQTVTSTMIVYTRESSKDGKQSWLTTGRSTIAYRRPGLYRLTRYDQQGNVRWVEIVDLGKNKFLDLDMKSKKATWRTHSQNQYSPDGPIASAKFLEHEDIQFVGQRKVGDATANVFRYHLKGDHSSFDVWVDANSKHLLGYSSPGADVFDPDTMADRNNPPGKFYEGTMLGSVTTDIVVDAKLDDALFDMKVPEGFEVVVEPPLPIVTEDEMIDYLGTCARFNDGVFPDTDRGIDLKKLNRAAKKVKSERTEAEQKMVDLNFKYMMAHHSYPIWDFAEGNTVPKSFRYVGGGVKLGEADRIVCWYKLKGGATLAGGLRRFVDKRRRSERFAASSGIGLRRKGRQLWLKVHELVRAFVSDQSRGGSVSCMYNRIGRPQQAAG